MTIPKVDQIAELQPGLQGQRDAFHVPAVLVECNVQLVPGTWVKFTNDDCKAVTPAYGSEVHAVAAPLMMGIIPANKLFWVFLKPDITQNLTHHFEINLPESVDDPDFQEPEPEDDDGCRGCYEPEPEEDDDGCSGCYS